MIVHTDPLPILELVVFGILGAFVLLRLLFPPRKFGEAALRLGCLGCLFLSASHPAFEYHTEHHEALALVDVSESVEAISGDEMLSTMGKVSTGVSIPLLPFSAQIAPTTIGSAAGGYTRLRSAWGSLNSGGTNIQQALESVSGRFSGNLLLASDGWETEGDVEGTFQLLRERGVRVFPLVPVHRGEQTEQVFVSQLDVPLVAPTGSSAPIRVSVRNGTDAPQSGVLEVLHDGKKVESREVQIGANEELLVTAESDPAKEGTREIIATFVPKDQKFPKSSRTALLSVEQRERVHLLSGTLQDEDALQQVLSAQGFQIRTVRGDEGRARIEDFSKVSAVILNNISLQQLATELPRQLVEYVERGGKLIMVGGNRSFGLGGYIASPIERILPVTLLPPMTEAKRLNVAVQIVLDKSQSMAADQKLDFAKDAGREVIRMMKEEDLIGIIGFDDAPFIALPLSPVGVNRALALERIGRIYPKGRTYLFPALDEARRALMRVNAGRKHVLVLTDGKLPDGGPFYLEFVRQLRLVGVTVSTVLLGDEIDTSLLKSMADLGGGAFYQTNDPRNLPRIFLADIRVVSGERTMRERTEYTVKRGPAGEQLTRIEAFPSLLGYVQTKPKEGAELELVVAAEGKADPLLAQGGVGKGNVIAFTSDANGRWSSNWVRWGSFSQFWVDILGGRDSAKEKESPRFDLRPIFDRGKLVLDLSVFSEAEGSAVSASLKDSSGRIQEVGFEQVAPGRYRGIVDRPRAGRYDIKARLGKQPLTAVAFSLSGENFAEQRGRGFNVPLLESLARETGGVVNPTDEMLRRIGAETVERSDLSTLSLLLALLLFLAEVLVRQGVFPPVSTMRSGRHNRAERRVEKKLAA